MFSRSTRLCANGLIVCFVSVCCLCVYISLANGVVFNLITKQTVDCCNRRFFSSNYYLYTYLLVINITSYIALLHTYYTFFHIISLKTFSCIHIIHWRVVDGLGAGHLTLSDLKIRRQNGFLTEKK